MTFLFMLDHLLSEINDSDLELDKSIALKMNGAFILNGIFGCE
jgi:hypothetical protein